MVQQIFLKKLLLMRKQTGMHLPILALLACAVGGNRGLESLWVAMFQGKIEESIFHLAGS